MFPEIMISPTHGWSSNGSSVLPAAIIIFKHNDVLFLCLNTENGGSSTHLSDEQIEYFRKVIHHHAACPLDVCVFTPAGMAG